MTKLYALDGARVLHLGTELLSLENIRFCVSHMLPRKMRKAGEHTRILDAVARDGSATFSWNLSRSRWWSKHTEARIRITLAPDGFYRLECISDDSYNLNYDLVDRVNRANDFLAKRFAAQEAWKLHARELKQKANGKKRCTRESKAPQPANASQPRTGKRRRTFAQAVPERLEKLTPQFRNQRLFWDEAIRATAHIFGVKSDLKYTAHQIVARRLHRSLEKSGGRFARFERGGFVLRFDLVDGRWRGDITPLLISATKDNEHPLYRRMRHYFRDKLIHAGVTSKKQRRARLEAARALPSNVTIWGGIRFIDRHVA